MVHCKKNFANSSLSFGKGSRSGFGKIMVCDSMRVCFPKCFLHVTTSKRFVKVDRSRSFPNFAKVLFAMYHRVWSSSVRGDVVKGEKQSFGLK